MVVAVTEGRQLDDPRVGVGGGAEFLGEDRMGDAGVLALVAAVGNARADVVGPGQVMIEIGADTLNR